MGPTSRHFSPRRSPREHWRGVEAQRIRKQQPAIISEKTKTKRKKKTNQALGKSKKETENKKRKTETGNRGTQGPRQETKSKAMREEGKSVGRAPTDCEPLRQPYDKPTPIAENENVPMSKSSDLQEHQDFLTKAWRRTCRPLKQGAAVRFAQVRERVEPALRTLPAWNAAVEEAAAASLS